MLSACDSDQGPSSDVSQVYGNINNILQTLKVEIAVNVFMILVLCANLGIKPDDSSSALSAAVNVFEACGEVLQVVTSVLIYIDLDATIRGVFLLSEKLIGAFSPDSELCLLPCCNPAFC
jgi:hypothetical protein